MGQFKHGHGENETRNGVQFEKQVGGNELSSSAIGELQETTQRVKRSRGANLPESANSIRNLVLHAKRLDVSLLRFIMENDSSSPHLSPVPTSASVECDSSATDTEELECIAVSQPSEFSASEVEELSQSAYVGYHSEDASRYLAPVHVDRQDMNEAELTDVQLTVDASYHAENVPFVSLTSKLNGISIHGHPVEIGVLSGSSGTLLPGKESGDCKLLFGEGRKVRQLVWRTSKRTPVCYVTNSVCSISGNSKGGKLSKNAGNLIPLSKEDSVLMKEWSIDRFLKNPCKFKRGRAAPRTTCVSVEHIFSNILAAVGRV